MLKGNLEKVVQHGKRADSIVKNMLLHSRDGSGEHRPVISTRLVEESLNLAYHGARAENREFKINLKRSFDPNGGESRSVSAGDHTRPSQPDFERLLCGDKAQGGEREHGYEPTLPPRPKTSVTASRSGSVTAAPAFRPR